MPDPKEIDSRPVSELKYTWEEESSKGSATLSDADCAPRDLGYETDWLATPAFGVTGKKSISKSQPRTRLSEKVLRLGECLHLHRACKGTAKGRSDADFTSRTIILGWVMPALRGWLCGTIKQSHTSTVANNPKPEREGRHPGGKEHGENYIRHQQNLVNDSLQHQRDVRLGARPPCARCLQEEPQANAKCEEEKFALPRKI